MIAITADQSGFVTTSWITGSAEVFMVMNPNGVTQEGGGGRICHAQYRSSSSAEHTTVKSRCPDRVLLGYFQSRIVRPRFPYVLASLNWLTVGLPLVNPSLKSGSASSSNQLDMGGRACHWI